MRRVVFVKLGRYWKKPRHRGGEDRCGDGEFRGLEPGGGAGDEAGIEGEADQCCRKIREHDAGGGGEGGALFPGD